MDKKLLLKLLLTIISLSLTGCIGSSIATTGAQAIYSHRSLQQTFNDQYIIHQAYKNIYINNNRFKNSNVSVTAFNNEALLTGEIPTQEQHDEIDSIVKRISGVKEVYNMTTISPPSSTLTRMSDSWLTTKVKAKIIAEEELDPSTIKVVSDKGTVYLMGIVQPEEADIAVELARNTEGVQNVVKVFSYIRITKV